MKQYKDCNSVLYKSLHLKKCFAEQLFTEFEIFFSGSFFKSSYTREEEATKLKANIEFYVINGDMASLQGIFCLNMQSVYISSMGPCIHKIIEKFIELKPCVKENFREDALTGEFSFRTPDDRYYDYDYRKCFYLIYDYCSAVAAFNIDADKKMQKLSLSLSVEMQTDKELLLENVNKELKEELEPFPSSGRGFFGTNKK